MFTRQPTLLFSMSPNQTHLVVKEVQLEQPVSSHKQYTKLFSQLFSALSPLYIFMRVEMDMLSFNMKR